MMQQQMTGLVDIDKSGRLNKAELRKLIRMYWEKELKMMQDAFAAHCNKSERCSLQQVEKAFRQIDFVDGQSRTPVLCAESHAIAKRTNSCSNLDSPKMKRT